MPPSFSRISYSKKKVHVYELTHHEDDYDLRYRLKDKLYLPSTRDAAASTATASLSSFVTPTNEGKEESKRPDRSSRSSGEVSDSRGGRAVGETGVNDSTAGGRSFLLVTWSHVILCEGRMLQLYEFSGAKVETGGRGRR